MRCSKERVWSVAVMFCFFWWAGCATAPGGAPDEAMPEKTGVDKRAAPKMPRKFEGGKLEREKKPKGGVVVEEEVDMSPATGSPAPGGGGRDVVESLVADIERKKGLYREDFGVESDDVPDTEARSCEDVCDASLAICKSAEEICRISSAMPGDGQVAERCTWAQGECTKAEEICEACNP